MSEGSIIVGPYCFTLSNANMLSTTYLIDGFLLTREQRSRPYREEERKVGPLGWGTKFVLTEEKEQIVLTCTDEKGDLFGEYKFAGIDYQVALSRLPGLHVTINGACDDVKTALDAFFATPSMRKGIGFHETKIIMEKIIGTKDAWVMVSLDEVAPGEYTRKYYEKSPTKGIYYSVRISHFSIEMKDETRVLKDDHALFKEIPGLTYTTLEKAQAGHALACDFARATLTFLKERSQEAHAEMARALHALIPDEPSSQPAPVTKDETDPEPGADAPDFNDD